MCVNMLLHADDVNYRDVEESAGRQQHFSVDNKPCSTFTPQHLDIEKIEREIKWEQCVLLIYFELCAHVSWAVSR